MLATGVPGLSLFYANLSGVAFSSEFHSFTRYHTVQYFLLSKFETDRKRFTYTSALTDLQLHSIRILKMQSTEQIYVTTPVPKNLKLGISLIGELFTTDTGNYPPSFFTYDPYLMDFY